MFVQFTEITLHLRVEDKSQDLRVSQQVGQQTEQRKDTLHEVIQINYGLCKFFV